MSISGKQLDSVQNETLAISAMEVTVDKKHNRPLLLHKAQTQTDGRKPSKSSISEVTVLLG